MDTYRITKTYTGTLILFMWLQTSTCMVLLGCYRLTNDYTSQYSRTDWNNQGNNLQDISFNLTKCAETCRASDADTYNYMAVNYATASSVVDCRCSSALPGDDSYIQTDEDSYYCGRQCTSSPDRWCIERYREPIQDRMVVYSLEIPAPPPTSTPAPTTTPVSTPTSVPAPSPGLITTEHTTVPTGASPQVNTTRSQPAATGLGTGEIAGVAFGAVVFIGLLILGIPIFVLLKRRKKSAGDKPPDDPQAPDKHPEPDTEDGNPGKIDPYEEWSMPRNPANNDRQSPDGATDTAIYLYANTGGSVEDLYAQPDRTKKAKAKQRQNSDLSEDLCIVDNDVYAEHGGTTTNNGGTTTDDHDDATYENVHERNGVRPDTIFPPS